MDDLTPPFAPGALVRYAGELRRVRQCDPAWGVGPCKVAFWWVYFEGTEEFCRHCDVQPLTPLEQLARIVED